MMESVPVGVREGVLTLFGWSLDHQGKPVFDRSPKSPAPAGDLQKAESHRQLIGGFLELRSQTGSQPAPKQIKQAFDPSDRYDVTA